jgi:hypothetical protein
MSEARHHTVEARHEADAAEGPMPGGRHRGQKATEDNPEAVSAHGRHRRPGGTTLQEA